MDNELVKIEIASSFDGQEIDLTVAEMGVLLVAINRSLNKLVISAPEILDKLANPSYDSINQEPAFIQLKLHSVKKGSLILHTIVEALNTVGLDPVSAKSVVLSVLANVIYDKVKAKTIVNDISRGVKRVAKSASGKEISISITAKNKTILLKAKISNKGQVKVDFKLSQSDNYKIDSIHR